MKIENLKEERQYELLEELSHNELLVFVQQQLKVKNSIRVIFYGLNIAIVAFIAYIVFLRYWSRLLNMDILMQIGLGFFLFFIVLLPLHELIHGVAYRMMGAAKVNYVAQWRKLVFYAMADRFIAGKKAFMIIALAPCIVINVFLLIGFAVAGVQAEFIFLSALLLHTSGCMGDFAMVSFFQQHHDKEVYTYDDALAAKTYFYARKGE